MSGCIGTGSVHAGCGGALSWQGLESALTAATTPGDDAATRLGRLESVGDFLAVEVLRRAEADASLLGGDIERAVRMWAAARGVSA